MDYFFFKNKINPNTLTTKTIKAAKTIVKSRMFLPAQSIKRNLWKMAKE
jgi:hypothetical protein